MAQKGDQNTTTGTQTLYEQQSNPKDLSMEHPEMQEGKATQHSLPIAEENLDESMSANSTDSAPSEHTTTDTLGTRPLSVNHGSGRTGFFPQEVYELMKVWTGLFCFDQLPPDRVGIQTKKGDYPLVPGSKFDLEKHFTGSSTFTIPICHRPDGSAEEVCKAMAFDIDDLEGASEISKRLTSALSDLNIPVYREFSGKKGLHVWIFLDRPIPKNIAVRFLKHIKSIVPFQGECIPGDNGMIKVGPCLHQVSKNVAYFLDHNEAQPQTFDRCQLLKIIPQQLERLRSVKFTDSNIVLALAGSLPGQHGAASNPDEMKALLSNLPLNSHPPCIEKLLEKGGAAALKTFDKNSLTLMTYANARQLSSQEINALGKRFIEHPNSPVETTKDATAKWKHFNSIEKAQATQNGFMCTYILAARKELQFKCMDCSARPVGVNTGMASRQTLTQQPSNVEGTHSSAENSKTNANPNYFGFQYNSVTTSTDATDPLARYRIRFHQGTDLLAACSEGTFTPENVDSCVFIYGEDRLIYESMKSGIFSHPLILKNIETMDIKILKNIISFHTTKYKDQNDDVRGICLKSCDTRLHYLRSGLKVSDFIDDLIEEAGIKTTAYKSRNLLFRSFSKLEDYGEPVEIMTSVTSEARKLISSLSQVITTTSDYLPQYIKELRTFSEKIPTSVAELDEHLLGGFSGRSLTAVAGTPSSGKTTFASQCADHAAANGIPTIIVSLEMDRFDLTNRGVSRCSGLPVKYLESGEKVLKDNEEMISDAIDRYVELVGDNLWIVNGSDVTSPAKILSYVEQFRSSRNWPEDKAVLVVVDYLQLMSSGDESVDFGGDEVAKISKIARSLKTIAIEGNMAMIAISEITKDEIGKAPKDSGMSLNAMRGSSRIAFSADVVLFLYSEEGKKGDGKKPDDPWSLLAATANNPALTRRLEKARKEYPAGKDDCAAYSVLEVAKNRKGIRGKKIPLIYQKALHCFLQV